MATVESAIKQAPAAKPAKANNPIPKANMRMFFIELSYAPMVVNVT
jgi:hypothetical protein